MQSHAVSVVKIKPPLALLLVAVVLGHWPDAAYGNGNGSAKRIPVRSAANNGKVNGKVDQREIQRRRKQLERRYVGGVSKSNGSGTVKTVNSAVTRNVEQLERVAGGGAEKGVHTILVTDTNFWIHNSNPKTLLNRPVDLVVPAIVIDELDGLRKGAVGADRSQARDPNASINAHYALKFIQEHMVPGQKYAPATYKGDNNFQLRIVQSKKPRDGRLNDDLIFDVVREEYEDRGREVEVTLLTSDVPFAIKARSQGFPVQVFEKGQDDIQRFYPGWSRLVAPDETVCRLQEAFGKFNSKTARAAFSDAEQNDSGESDAEENVEVLTVPFDDKELVNGQFVEVRDEANQSSGIPAIYRDKALHPIYEFRGRHRPMGVVAKNREQAFALHALFDPNVQFVSLMGKAGTGKTFLAMAAGLAQMLRDAAYADGFERVLALRPNKEAGDELGFLPGTLNEKIEPWLAAIFDNLQELARTNHGKDGSARVNQEKLKEKVEEWKKSVEGLALSYLRGRTFPRSFLVVDEAQNLTRAQAKMVLTRAGEGTKVVFTGDPYQIDGINFMSSGLPHVINRFKGQRTFAHVTLTEVERSGLAGLAADLL